ncbi:DUF1656 domain-containing protein [Shewanella sp. 1_MG-2023]|jgi:hypothetical protein|uniref:DUF1656 domain-containing protein n=1 Tax=Shewanella electrodiphila TaxID=934143 RepID=A0ABT0KN97_9GAMM|nr:MULTISPECIES: DUF1656 domain-containing protein [Shewanella]MCC4833140.1 DUF1656 domain-containing protein [Shewanella sp. 10N.7]MCL1045313.1 DUF1656 domain-containing protein [Shewanella electrodiphila]MDO6611274.1 DUF1656 domain-containing protein [Shewanella sp. 7_MG-2023]MDO6771129.1 DUF1656 domain-containing protein [Shewanella sp. 2_MG-2023]MDO6796630.1 DUF1656 domain-containing protein [Shewanella sp. 1_MG-2023]
MPHEFAIGEVYFPPLLIVVMLAYFLTVAVTFVAGKLGWQRVIALPALVELCMVVIFTVLLSRFIAFT